MAECEAFVAAPSEEALDKCTKEQLLKLSDYYSVAGIERKRKEDIKIALKVKLIELGVLTSGPVPASPPAVGMPFETQGLTFEQQKELLSMQLEHERFKCEIEAKKQIELEVIRQREGYRLAAESQRGQVSGVGARPFDTNNLRLLPPFNERDPDSFFVLFERVSAARGWSDEDCALLLQCVLTGKAQGAYSSMSAADSSSYVKIKSAVLKAYELVPEAYRQRFRAWERESGQTYVEFVRDLTTHFKRWLAALDISTFDELCELVILEQFKNTLPGLIAIYINEQKVASAAEAALAADEYVLLHKGDVRERTPGRNDSGWGGNRRGVAAADQMRSETSGMFRPESHSRSSVDSSITCNYCREMGHWKADCPGLQSRHRGSSYNVKPAAAAATLGNGCVSNGFPSV